MIYLVATSRAKPGHEDDLRASLTALIAPTRGEEGCVQYDLHEETDAPGAFLFYEIWDSQAALDAHAASAHLHAHHARAADWIAESRLILVRKLA